MTTSSNPQRDIQSNKVQPVEIAGITVLSFNNAGSSNLWTFKINRDEQELAITCLIAALDTFDSISLADHSRGDDESAAFYERLDAGYRVMVGGHGWSADWVMLDSAEIITDMRKRLQYNYGNQPSETGRLQKTKKI